MVGNISEIIEIFLLSMTPFIESRYAVPFIAIHQYNWEWWQAFPIALLGNIILVPFILIFFKKVETYLRQFPRWKHAMNWGFPLVRKHADKKIQRYKTFALVTIIAIPLPFTGAGLGSLIAYLFDLPLWRSFWMIFIGVVLSTSTTTILYFLGIQFLF